MSLPRAEATRGQVEEALSNFSAEPQEAEARVPIVSVQCWIARTVLEWSATHLRGRAVLELGGTLRARWRGERPHRRNDTARARKGRHHPHRRERRRTGCAAAQGRLAEQHLYACLTDSRAVFLLAIENAAGICNYERSASELHRNCSPTNLAHEFAGLRDQAGPIPKAA
jgi:hypothetical protein